MKAILEFLAGLFNAIAKAGKEKEPAGEEEVYYSDDPVEIDTIPRKGQKGEHVRKLQTALKKAGYSLKVDGDFGPKTEAAVSKFQKAKGLRGSGVIGSKTLGFLNLVYVKVEYVSDIFLPGIPVYPRPHRFHPRWDAKLEAPYTHIHPLDAARSVAGEKEIPGRKHNMFIAHLHEHSGNLGKWSEEPDYSDEVPHCSSGLNWAADMCGCEKSDNALAASWSWKKSRSYNPRKGDWVEEGDIIHIKNGDQNHVTLANKRFNRKKAKTFEGFGFNQGNSIKTSRYKVDRIISVQVWKPKAGTVLAPIGHLGQKPVPSTGKIGESTR